MKKLNSLSGGKMAVIAVTFLLPTIGMSEYDDYSSRLGDLSKETSKVGDVLSSSQATGSEESFQEKIEKTKQLIKKGSAIAKTKKEEQDQRDKLLNWTNKNQGLKGLLALPDTIMQNAINKRETDLNTAESLLSSLGKKNSFINPQDFSMNGLPKECSKNVDFTQFMALTDQLGSEPFKYLQSEARSLLEEKVEDLRKKKAAKIADILKHFKELANKEEGDDIQKISEDKSIEARLQRLKAANKAKKEENKDLKNSLVDVFGKFIGDLGSLQKNDKRVQQLGDEFAKSLENSQRALMMTAQQNVDQLFANCESQIKTLKIEIENFRDQLVSKGWDPAVAEADAQAQRNRVAGMQCQDVTQNVQSLIMGFGTGGTALADRLSSIRAEKNPTKLLSSAVAAMQDVANIQQQVGSQLKPLKDDCEAAGLGREGLKQRFAQLGSPQQGGQSRNTSNGRPSTNGSIPGQPRQAGVGSPTTHGTR